MRVVVTGSSGRLGRSLSTGLAASGHAVVGVDRAPVDLSGVDVRAADLLDEHAVEALLADTRPDAVVHLAGIAVPFSAPERDILLANTSLAHTVLAAAARAGVGRVLAASSPTVIGYGSAGWRASTVPIDEAHPREPSNAYAISKLVIEETSRMFSRTTDGAYGWFRPCYVVSPEEWTGAATQQGHTMLERLDDPALAAVSLFNYLDARDAASFAEAWLAAPPEVVDGEGFFVGAADALARRPVAELWRDHVPGLGPDADRLTGTRPVFSIEKAAERLGWRPERDWRTELAAATSPAPVGPPGAPNPASPPNPAGPPNPPSTPSASTSDESAGGNTRARRKYSRSAEGARANADADATSTLATEPRTP